MFSNYTRKSLRKKSKFNYDLHEVQAAKVPYHFQEVHDRMNISMNENIFKCSATINIYHLLQQNNNEMHNTASFEEKFSKQLCSSSYVNNKY